MLVLFLAFNFLSIRLYIASTLSSVTFVRGITCSIRSSNPSMAMFMSGFCACTACACTACACASTLIIFFVVCIMCCIFVRPSFVRSSIDPDISSDMNMSCPVVTMGVSEISICKMPKFCFGSRIFIFVVVVVAVCIMM